MASRLRIQLRGNTHLRRARGQATLMRMMPVRVHATCLESLRRSTWLAGLLLLVCLMRVGMVMACAPHDIAESLAGGAHAVIAEQVGDDSSSSDQYRCWSLPALRLSFFGRVARGHPHHVCAFGPGHAGAFSNAPRQRCSRSGAEATDSLNRGSPCPVV